MSLNDFLRPLLTGDVSYQACADAAQAAQLARRVSTPSRQAADLKERRFSVERGVLVLPGQNVEYLVKVTRTK